MAFEQWDKFLVCDEDIQNLSVSGVTYGFEFKLQYPTYRGTYLSCIESLAVEVDGKEVTREDMVFVINGKICLIDELKDLYKEYWFITDHASICVLGNKGLEAGSNHTVRVTMKHRIPYTGYFGSYLAPVSVCEKKLAVEMTGCGDGDN
jgi:hypothetical protein